MGQESTIGKRKRFNFRVSYFISLFCSTKRWMHERTPMAVILIVVKKNQEASSDLSINDILSILRNLANQSALSFF